jgi:hypothetical protein
MYWRVIPDQKEPLTLAWGALCPRTAAGQDLLSKIMGVMASVYAS